MVFFYLFIFLLLIFFLMICIMHVLCTGNNYVTKEKLSSHNVQMDNNFEGILLFIIFLLPGTRFMGK